jgi:hypothetical protein
VLTRRPRQWYVRHDRLLNRIAAVCFVAGAGVLVASPADAAGVNVTPTEALLYGLNQITVSGYSSVLTTVYFNGVAIGQVEGDVDSSYYSTTLPLPPAGSPGAAHCGANTVTIAESTGTVTADCAAIQVTPNPVLAGQLPGKFTVAPTNFPLRELYQLTLDGTPETITYVPGTTDLSFTATPACGTHQVVLTQRYRATPVSAQAPLTVLCPAVTVNPGSIQQPAEPVQVTAQGTGFQGGQPVSVLVDGKPVASGTTDPTGAVTLPFPAAGLGCGSHQVTLVENGPLTPTATTTLAVTNCAGTATLAINPVVVQSGMLTEATGSGFTPNQPVVLTWQAPDGTPLLGSTTVTASPTGTIDTYCMVFDNGELGDRQLVATQGTTTATTPAVVDGGTMQPSAGDQLVFRR